MTDYSHVARKLEDFLQKHVPLIGAAAIQIDEYNGDKLIASAPLDKNINDKGTAFGGSLYNLCVSAGWGMAHLKTQALGLEGELVVAKGEISYLKPLRGRLIATAQSPDEAQLARIKQSYLERGLASFFVDVIIFDEQQHSCAEFRGKYAIVSSEKTEQA